MIAALDIAKVTGVCVRYGPRKYATWTTAGGEESFTKLAAKFNEMGVKHCAIEDAYLGCNPKTFGKLMTLIAIAETCLHFAGITTERIPASTWQANWGIKGKRDEVKFGSANIARWLGAKITKQDEADAVCLCEYAATKGAKCTR